MHVYTVFVVIVCSFFTAEKNALKGSYIDINPKLSV